MFMNKEIISRSSIWEKTCTYNHYKDDDIFTSTFSFIATKNDVNNLDYTIVTVNSEMIETAEYNKAFEKSSLDIENEYKKLETKEDK